MLLGTDTAHRRFLINRLLDQGWNLSHCLFETETKQPKFPVKPSWYSHEEEELDRLFSCDTSRSLERVQAHYFGTLNSADSIRCLASLDWDFAIVSGAGRIKSEMLSLIAGKSLNVHIGIAEKYRGLDTNLWAIYHSEVENIGVTLHELEDELDTGNIFFQETLVVTPDINMLNLRYFETILALELLEKALHQFCDGRLKGRAQVEVGRYYSFMPAVLKEHLSISKLISA